MQNPSPLWLSPVSHSPVYLLYLHHWPCSGCHLLPGRQKEALLTMIPAEALHPMQWGTLRGSFSLC